MRLVAEMIATARQKKKRTPSSGRSSEPAASPQRGSGSGAVEAGLRDDATPAHGGAMPGALPGPRRPAEGRLAPQRPRRGQDLGSVVRQGRPDPAFSAREDRGRGSPAPRQEAAPCRRVPAMVAGGARARREGTGRRGCVLRAAHGPCGSPLPNTQVLAVPRAGGNNRPRRGRASHSMPACGVRFRPPFARSPSWPPTESPRKRPIRRT